MQICMTYLHDLDKHMAVRADQRNDSSQVQLGKPVSVSGLLKGTCIEGYLQVCDSKPPRSPRSATSFCNRVLTYLLYTLMPPKFICTWRTGGTPGMGPVSSVFIASPSPLPKHLDIAGFLCLFHRYDDGPKIISVHDS